MSELNRMEREMFAHLAFDATCSVRDMEQMYAKHGEESCGNHPDETINGFSLAR